MPTVRSLHVAGVIPPLGAVLGMRPVVTRKRQGARPEGPGKAGRITAQDLAHRQAGLDRPGLVRPAQDVHAAQ